MKGKELTKEEAYKVLKAWAARTGGVKLLDGSFPEQTAFIEDPSKLKAALCSRRSGKSYGLGLYLFKEALAEPGCKVLYVGLTRDAAKNSMWDHVLKKINQKHRLGATFNEVALTVKLPNGSFIYIVGANSSKDLKDKLRGGKYRLAVVDECQSYTQSLREIITNVIEPAVMDHDGTICLTGTPGNLIRTAKRRNSFGESDEDSDTGQYHFWYSVTNELEPGWSVHKWLTSKNPYNAANYQKQIERKKLANPFVTETPAFKQEFLGEWFVDTEALVYKYDELRNSCVERDTIELFYDATKRAQFSYVLGIDFGYTDAMGFVVCAYNQHDPNMYVVETYKKEKMPISGLHSVDQKIKQLRAKYPISKFIVDNAAKQSVEELKQRFSHPLEAADKKDKANFISIMNSDLIMGKIQVLPGNDALVAEWQTLIWDDRSDRLQENSACENHLSDACLYAWRYCYNYLSRNAPKEIKPGSAEHMKEYWEKQSQELQRRQTMGTEESWESDSWDVFSND